MPGSIRPRTEGSSICLSKRDHTILSGSETCLYPIGSRVGAQGAQGVPVARPLRAAQVGRCGEDQQGKRVATLSAWEKQCEVEERVACELEGKGRVA